MELISCRRAIEQDLSHYFTGKPCKYGHIAIRHVSSRTCYECTRIRENDRYQNLDDIAKTVYLADQREYNRNNAHLFRAYAKRTNAERRTRTPPWSEHKEILQFYKNCPPGYEVDHIIPLLGKLVSGLHVLSNLQYLTKTDNRCKGNKFNVT